MLDSFKCLTYPEKNLDYSTPSPVDNTNITNGSSSSESNSYLGLKTSREEQKSMESSRGMCHGLLRRSTSFLRPISY